MSTEEVVSVSADKEPVEVDPCGTKDKLEVVLYTSVSSSLYSLSDIAILPLEHGRPTMPSTFPFIQLLNKIMNKFIITDLKSGLYNQ